MYTVLLTAKLIRLVTLRVSLYTGFMEPRSVLFHPPCLRRSKSPPGIRPAGCCRRLDRDRPAPCRRGPSAARSARFSARGRRISAVATGNARRRCLRPRPRGKPEDRPGPIRGRGGTIFQGEAGLYSVRLHAVAEEDGESVYELIVDGRNLGRRTNPRVAEKRVPTTHAWTEVRLAPGMRLRVLFAGRSNGTLPRRGGFRLVARPVAQHRNCPLGLDSVALYLCIQRIPFPFHRVLDRRPFTSTPPSARSEVAPPARRFPFQRLLPPPNPHYEHEPTPLLGSTAALRPSSPLRWRMLPTLKSHRRPPLPPHQPPRPRPSC